MSEHTPGQWLLQGTTRGWIVEIPGIDEIRVGSACGPLETREEDLANARLIAAAPDLLAACEEIAAEHDPRYDNTTHGTLTLGGNPIALAQMLEACRDTARAAIAKAEGRNQTAPTIDP